MEFGHISLVPDKKNFPVWQGRGQGEGHLIHIIYLIVKGELYWPSAMLGQDPNRTKGVFRPFTLLPHSHLKQAGMMAAGKALMS